MSDDIPYELRESQTGACFDSEDGKLPAASPWTTDGYRACDAAEMTKSGDDVVRCPKRAVLQARYLVLKPDVGTRDSGFCADHQDAGVAALYDGAERGEIHEAMQMRVSTRGFRRGV